MIKEFISIFIEGGETKTVKSVDYIKSKTKHLQEYWFSSVTEKQVTESLDRILAGEPFGTDIDPLVKVDINICKSVQLLQPTTVYEILGTGKLIPKQDDVYRMSIPFAQMYCKMHQQFVDDETQSMPDYWLKKTNDKFLLSSEDIQSLIADVWNEAVKQSSIQCDNLQENLFSVTLEQKINSILP